MTRIVATRRTKLPLCRGETFWAKDGGRVLEDYPRWMVSDCRCSSLKPAIGPQA